MALVAPSIVRFTINGTYLGRPTANVLDVLIVDELAPEDRAQGAENYAEYLRGQWTDHVLPLLSSSYSAESVTFVDLDSETGATGRARNEVSPVWPRAGGISGVPYAGSVALLVTKGGNARRGQRQGRWFLPGLSEANVTGNTVDADMVAAVNVELAEMLEALSAGEGLPFEGALPVVVHTKNVGTPTDPVIEYEGHSTITSLTAQGRVASQRRRNRA